MSLDGADLPLVGRDAIEAARAERGDVDGHGHGTGTGPPGTRARVAGVLLAAGESSRYGEANKLLAELDGEPIVRRAARTLLEADLVCVVAVLGHEADSVRGALDGLDLEVCENPDYARGQSTSVRAGVGAIEAGPDVDGAVFGLGDMPRVRSETVDLLVDAFGAGIGDPLAAAYQGTRGNPVLFGAGHFGALADATGDTGGRRLLLESEAAALVETGDPGVLWDVDTAADLERLR